MYLRDNILERYPNVWVTSDFHFNHRNILKFEARRAELFDNLESMNEGLVKIWNDKVGDDDLVLFLGDLSFTCAETVESRLKGHKVLVRGNHDLRGAEFFKPFGFFKVVSVAVWGKYVFTHIPIHPDEFQWRWKINVHGHTHSRMINDPRYFNACIDAHPNFTLWNLRDDIIAKFGGKDE